MRNEGGWQRWATIASPETILRWYRELVAKKYDGAQQRGQGRPKTAVEIAALVGKRYILIDRDPPYTEAFCRILGQGGVKVVRLPARSSNLNAFAERFVPSIKSECLERMVPLGEEYLRRALLEYMAHYHGERNHQGLGNALINGAEDGSLRAGPLVRRDRIDGPLHFYHRRAGWHQGWRNSGTGRDEPRLRRR